MCKTILLPYKNKLYTGQLCNVFKTMRIETGQAETEKPYE